MVDFQDISELMTCDEFERIKAFILNQGDRQTYRNYDCENPHYNFGSFHAYLGSELGQGNINNDPALSDFNELTLWTSDEHITYISLVIVRKKVEPSKIAWTYEGMRPNTVYVLDIYKKGLANIVNAVPEYLAALREIL